MLRRVFGTRSISTHDVTSRDLRASQAITNQTFCVVDVETTGLSPKLMDRVVEVAAVRIAASGEVIEEWTTLVNPDRDVGPTHIHGIRAGDVVDAPRFSDVAGDLLQLLDGAVLVAHNLRFDRSFIVDEFERAGHSLPPLPGLCTLALGTKLEPRSASRKLAASCARIGYTIPRSHAALDDARAASALLTAYLAIARREGLVDLHAVGCEPIVFPEQLPDLPATGLRRLRGTPYVHVEGQASYLAHLVEQLDEVGLDADTAAYLDLLDHALEDRRLTHAEAELLATTAAEWGLSRERVRRVHHDYLEHVVAIAKADGIVTEAELADLCRVAALLDLPIKAVGDALDHEGHATSTPSRELSLAGLSVCFTGVLHGTIDGSPVTRAMAHDLASKAGLEVRNSVTRNLDILVVADPDTLSAKAKRAQELGTRIIAEAAFWRMLEAPVR